MPTIEAERGGCTLTDVVTVRPERQQQLDDLLADANQTITQLPGVTPADRAEGDDPITCDVAESITA